MKEMVYCDKKKPEILDSGEYKGHKYVILSLGSYPTAYVENKIGVADYWDNILDDIEVHGGFTYFGNAHWDENGIDKTDYLGWDYAHLEDLCYNSLFSENGKKWTTEEIFSEVKNVIEQLIKIEEKE